jgi:hypothetical protein
MAWQNRIVGQGVAKPRDLVPHPDNWRVHSALQEAVLEASLDEVGFVQEVIVNRTTGHLVDGHLRVALALRRGEPKIPVTYVELSEAEERLALATLDPLSNMAAANAHLFGQLLEQANTGSSALQDFLNDYAQRIGAIPDGSESKKRERTGATEHGESDYGDFEHTCPECGFQFD